MALNENLQFVVDIVFRIIRTWWWLPLPFVLWHAFIYFWIWWRVEIWLKNTFKPILLEIRLPKEVLKPVRAMEQVLAGMHQACYEPPNFIEKWWEGQVLMSIHFEIVSLGGDIHFYIRSHEKYRQSIEANIYSQYPEAEISVAEDYTKNVPQDMPNKEWDFWATDYRFSKPSPYPIKTYKDFETETEPLEKKRIDPIAALLENLSQIKPGEQFWLQISACPLGADEAGGFLQEGKTLRDKLAKRPEKPKAKSMLESAVSILVFGKPPEEAAVEKDVIPPEMKMTPGEKTIVEGMENKISKSIFSCNARFIYMGKRDVWFKPNLRLGFGYFANFNTLNMNALFPYGKTLTKVKSRPLVNVLDRRRLYLRQRKIFRNYKDRFPPFFPLDAKWPVKFILNIEELASLFHFPSWDVAPVPGMSRVEAKKGAPPELPTE